MRIANQQFFFEQNELLRNKLQNFNPVNATESATPVNNTQPVDKVEEKKPELGATVDFSTSARVAGSESQTAKSFPTTNFSTDDTEETAKASQNVNSSVLNQYRFFVQSNQYEGSEGVVKRIFR